ncbi:MAG TPA: FecR domain-containing protein, partial [Gemmatimonadaceae bacterium]|nr:FecR domain-containing protein [Gemmatimonadaceae bacterium]
RKSDGTATARIDVDESWSHLSHALHLAPDSTSAAADSAALLRHDTAAHVKDLAKKPAWKLPAFIGVVAAIAIIAGIWAVNRMGDEGAITRALASQDARTHIAATGQMAKVGLDDGSSVLLTPESRLIVPKQFSDLMRVVKLDGEATFSIAPNKAKPFEVRAASAKVMASGTVLTVRAFGAESTVVVYTKEGTVSVQVGEKTQTVAPGKAVVVAKDGAMRDATQPEIDEATTWDHEDARKLTISNRQLRDALPMIKRWYGLDIKVLDLPLLDRPVTISAPLDSPQAAINAIEASANLKFDYEGQTMVFRDAPKKGK